ncbi:hypothetical protein GW901_01025 [Candidatus Parcubacteria bacterium]|uniref:Homing endonuclease LAGLIDADG domain-containing protein n=1 Tax=Candidatus Wolfebacteria bacterium CG_4_10_14_0_8_um_filter_39_64 TaxID=1975063 RepID=A0A2M7Q6A3_9BACT|nr:hypothetical protein [Candidatus Parcubacteria bacterium]NCO89611.1 hypothetical protein [Candidatus Wolfebacteria bacterium]NCQ02490.1 hypothetical protein [Candidatus Wolfebacteria bacterium]PIY58966.1 MAG: hypothetical protein COY97_01375 [Candidatus Wolfebacteria bacterium CG_4_10_14_0_8_um_filter_39_64]
MNLTKKQKSAIIGMVLGDGYLQKTGSRNARLRLEHRADHYDYLVWKTKILPQFFQGKPKILHSYVRHQSNASPYLGKIRALFYPNNKKIIPRNLEGLLRDNIGFVIWYYDDGYYYQRDHCFYLYLGKITKEEARIASNVVWNNFHLSNSVLDKKSKGFALYFSPTEREKIKKIVEKYYVPVMAYKIPS